MNLTNPKTISPSNRLQKGQSLVEYSLILAIIALTAIVVLQSLGTQITSKFSQMSSGLQSG